ncbi:MAG: hypothetical protein ACOCWC_01170 [Bacteroidota bacterium]
MKTISKLVLTALSLFLVINLSAQNCNFYYPLVENSKMQYQSFNKKDKLESTQEATVKNVKNVGGAVEATINSKVFDKKNKLMHEGDYTVSCSGNDVSIDMSSFLDPAMMAGFEDMEVQLETNDLSIPSELTVGETLKDASLKMVVSTAGMTIANTDLQIKNRKVEGKETVTTPAGTFEAYKVTYDNVITAGAMGMNQTVTTKTIEYLVKDLGSVKTESYDANGNSQGYTVLSKIY